MSPTIAFRILQFQDYAKGTSGIIFLVSSDWQAWFLLIQDSVNEKSWWIRMFLSSYLIISYIWNSIFNSTLDIYFEFWYKSNEDPQSSTLDTVDTVDHVGVLKSEPKTLLIKIIRNK